MNIEWNTMTFTLYGKPYEVKVFKQWYRRNYQPLMHKYHVINGIYDWQSIMSDAHQNGIIEIFKTEHNDKS